MIIIPYPLFYKSVLTNEEWHITDNISIRIKQVINEVDEEKVVTIIIDNASNMKAA